MKIFQYASLLLLVAFFANNIAAFEHEEDSNLRPGRALWGSGSCPTDASVGADCLAAVIPPWPICTYKTVAEFIATSKESAARCCDSGDGDISACSCPVKDGNRFQAKIPDWCAKVATC